jgi:AraC-like DNA-binding protein
MEGMEESDFLSARQAPAAMAVPPLIAFEGARALYLGRALGLKPHRNAAFTLAVGLDAPVRLTLHQDRLGPAATIAASIAAVPAGRFHRLEAEGDVAFLYFDPLCDEVGQAAIPDASAAHRAIVAEEREALRLWGFDRWREALGLATPDAVDPRVATIASAMVEDPNLYPSLSAAAQAAALSPTRFQAVFRRQLGAPFRRYRLWRRMGAAMAMLASGANLTEAAHGAGFSSSAHFSHQFLRMFGLAPSALMALKPEIRCERHGRV